MKILFFINSLHHGGAQRVMVSLAKMFSYEGNDVTIATAFIDKEWEYDLNDNITRITLFENKIENKITRNIKLVVKLRKLLKKNKYDVAISFMAEPNIRLLISSIGIKIKKIISVRNDPDREYPNCVFRFMARHLFKRANHVVFQTEEAKGWFPRAIQKRSSVIYNQLDSTFFDNNDNQTEKKNIISVGRLNRQKNQKLLIDAFQSISNSICDNIFIYGDGELKNELLEYVRSKGLQDRVFLKGPTKDIKKVLSESKLFVLTSDFEGMPNALMEAMAMGLTCISSDCPCGGPRELFGEELKNNLFPVGDKDSLSLLLLKYSLDDNVRLLSSKMSRNRAECFRTEKVFELWKNVVVN